MGHGIGLNYQGLKVHISKTFSQKDNSPDPSGAEESSGENWNFTTSLQKHNSVNFHPFELI